MNPWAVVGEVIAGRYRVDGLIGLGGMGSVLRCHHIGLGRDVALKVLHPERNVHAESSARFTREARSASRLDHPNCVRVLDFGEWQPRENLPAAKYLAMELIEGQELSRRLREPLPLRTALEFAGQILDGLDHAHARGIVHRDLKPENVIVTRVGTTGELLKLVDFGIAKIMGGSGVDARMTRTGRVFGTPQYMSPEQVSGGHVDGRTDLYAAGVLLYQMLTGALPFEADEPTVLMGKHLFTEPPRLPATMPPMLVSLVERLLQKEPEQRYATAAAARADLDLVIRELDLPTPPPLPPRRSLTRAWPLGIALLGCIAGAFALPGRGADDVVDPAPVDARRSMMEAMQSAAPRKTHAEIAAVQHLRGMADIDAALARADALLRVAPEDARLFLERARLHTRAGQGARALADYERALVHDPSILDARVLGEIAALGREPALHALALDLALQELGTDAHPLIAELLAADGAPLGYRDRHRALAAIAGGPSAPSVDMRRMTALDLVQADGAESPCLAFAAALAAMEREPAAVYLPALRRAVPPKPRARDTDATVALCNALPARHAEVRALVAHDVRQDRRVADARAEKARARTSERARARSKQSSAVNRLRGLAGVPHQRTSR